MAASSTPSMERAELMLRILAVVLLGAGAAGRVDQDPTAFRTLGGALGILVWVVVSGVGSLLGVLGDRMRGAWVFGLDLLLIAGVFLLGARNLDEISAVALVIPILLVGHRGHGWFAILLAIVASVAAVTLVRRLYPAHLDSLAGGSSTTSLRGLVHAFAWVVLLLGTALVPWVSGRMAEAPEQYTDEADRRLHIMMEQRPGILAARGPTELVRRVTQSARKIFDADSASIMRRTDEGLQLLGLSRLNRFIDGTAEAASAAPPSSDSLARVTIAEFVAFRDEPVLLDADLATDPRFRNVPTQGGIRSAICVPIKMGSRLFGVFNVSRTEEGSPPFTESDLRVAIVMSDFLAGTLSRLSDETGSEGTAEA